MDTCRMNYRTNPGRRTCGCPSPYPSSPPKEPSMNCCKKETSTGNSRKNEAPMIHWGDLPLAMGYVPDQHFHETFDLCKAFYVGTIFPELCQPFCGKGGGCSC